jgi:hypothetical protein
MRPRITFFCELETPALIHQFNDESLIPALQNLNACLSLGVLDFSPQRAEIVKRLNQAGIPVTAWILLPKELGYWSNIGNGIETTHRYDQFKEWTIEHGLRWSAVGLDIEPDIHLIQEGMSSSWSIFISSLKQFARFGRFSKAQNIFKELVARIKSDGFVLESYQFPLIVDDRMAKSTLVQRFLGILTIDSDREVLMLYSSFLGENSAGVIWSYGKDSRSIAVGSTGGGVELPKPIAVLSWEDFERDLLLAWRWSNDIYIFSLEGCIQQGFLEKLLAFEWDRIILAPSSQARKIDGWRISFQMVLWFLSYLPVLLGIGLILAVIIYSLVRKR